MAAAILMSSDFECLTAVEGDCDREANGLAAQAFVEAVGRLVPSLPGPSGIFTPYGRVYIDAGQHIELALRECGSPYEFALLTEQANMLAARATELLANTGTRLLLTNNVHGGLLMARNQATWGSHENYLVDRHPRSFGPEILPFLSTRVYGGAGGVDYASGDFLAGVRANYMTLDAGGHTTHDRALHSLGREEHHMGASPNRYRYHLLLGDGHSSQWNCAIHYGATALALKAIDFDRSLVHRLPSLPTNGDNPWVKITHNYNRLARAGERLRVAAVVAEVQRVIWMARAAMPIPCPIRPNGSDGCSTTGRQCSLRLSATTRSGSQLASIRGSSMPCFRKC
ncbi:MAG TPA: proteasome accessory factor PafA2 family protein [Pirellulales bacterium]|nr:proteasome accessory factor PafA2 family protein [Pirellulales bacterium]